jgi:hypothetical protein
MAESPCEKIEKRKYVIEEPLRIINKNCEDNYSHTRLAG